MLTLYFSFSLNGRSQWCSVLVTMVSCTHSQVLTSPKWVFTSWKWTWVNVFDKKKKYIPLYILNKCFLSSRLDCEFLQHTKRQWNKRLEWWWIVWRDGKCWVLFTIWIVMEAEMFMRNTASVAKDTSMITIWAAAMLFLKPSPFSLLSNMPQNPFSLAVFVYLSVSFQCRPVC